MGKKWRMGQLCLEWYHSAEREMGTLGMVWSRQPVYLAATITQIDGNYIISEYSLRGLSDIERASLEEYLSRYKPGSGAFE
jgi:hypothetical protein